MGLDYLASSPCVVLSPAQQRPLFHGIGFGRRRQSSPLAIGRKHPVPPSLNYLAAASNAAAGRKRSIHDVDADDIPRDGSVAIRAPVKSRCAPLDGSGTTPTISEDGGANATTWTKASRNTTAHIESDLKNLPASRKAQRTDCLSPIKELLSPTLTALNNDASKAKANPSGRTFDPINAGLGVGWKNIMTNEALSYAVRAYTRFIENHFPLSNPVIMLQSERLSAYFVRADHDGVAKFWLFHDSLQWCQLVASSLDQATQNLKVEPIPRVEGPQIQATSHSSSSINNNVTNTVSNDDDDLMQL